MKRLPQRDAAHDFADAAGRSVALLSALAPEEQADHATSIPHGIHAEQDEGQGEAAFI